MYCMWLIIGNSNHYCIIILLYYQFNILYCIVFNLISTSILVFNINSMIITNLFIKLLPLLLELTNYTINIKYNNEIMRLLIFWINY